MKVLLVNQTFHPDTAATAQLLTDCAQQLSRDGHEVTVLTGRRGYTNPQVMYPVHETFDGIKIVRVMRFHIGRQRRLRRLLDALLVNLCFARRFIHMGGYDHVVALTSPPLVAWVALQFAKLRGSKFTYWLMDVNPDQAIAAGWLRPGAPWTWLLEKVLRSTLSGSDKVIVLDRFMRDRVVAKGTAPARVEVQAPWVYQEELKPVDHADNLFRQEHGLQGKFVVMYAGNHSLCHPVRTLLDAAERLRGDKEVVFVFVGGGPRQSEVASFKQERGLDNILVLPYQERSELSHSLSAGDLQVVLMGDPYVGIVHPCKIYPLLKVGRPMLYVGPRESAIGEILAKQDVGYQATHGDVGAVLSAIAATRALPAKEREDLAARMHALCQACAMPSAATLIRTVGDHEPTSSEVGRIHREDPPPVDRGVTLVDTHGA